MIEEEKEEEEEGEDKWEVGWGEKNTKEWKTRGIMAKAKGRSVQRTSFHFPSVFPPTLAISHLGRPPPPLPLRPKISPMLLTLRWCVCQVIRRPKERVHFSPNEEKVNTMHARKEEKKEGRNRDRRKEGRKKWRKKGRMEGRKEGIREQTSEEESNIWRNKLGKKS